MPQPVKISVQLLQRGVKMECKNCGGTLFTPLVNIVFVSRLNPENPAGQDIMGNLPIGMYCVTCNKEAKPVMPKVKKEKDKVVN